MTECPSTQLDTSTLRDALHDYADVPCSLLIDTGDDPQPTATIAVPTFKRPKWLAESVASAIAQRSAPPFEVIVIDNDPEGALPEALAEDAARAGVSFRYFRNTRNIGMYGNWNRCIELARGKWVTILNDDDLLDPAFLIEMLEEARRHPSSDGLVCRKAFFDDRPNPSLERVTARSRARMALTAFLFRGNSSRRLLPSKFFWGAVTGNGAGFIFRRKCALQIGGYYPEEAPSSDYWFTVRFARIGHLRECIRQLAWVRATGENESANPAAMRRGLLSVYRLQTALLQRDVPRWWKMFLPWIVARDLADIREGWRVDIPPAEAESILGIRIPRHRRVLLWIARLVFGGF